MHKKYTNVIKVVVLSFAFSVGIGIAFATWTAPTDLPPGNNTPPPINVGRATQTKYGNLFLGSGYTFGSTLGLFGQVGIGTTNPQAVLDVNMRNSNEVRFFNDNPIIKNGFSHVTDMIFEDTRSGKFWDLAVRGDDDHYSPNSAHLSFFNNSKGNRDTDDPANWTGAMTYLANGNVGIGTANPQAKLEVKGDLKVRGGESVVSGCYRQVQACANDAVSCTATCREGDIVTGGGYFAFCGTNVDFNGPTENLNGWSVSEPKKDEGGGVTRCSGGDNSVIPYKDWNVFAVCCSM